MPFRYKENAVNVEPHRGKNIASNFQSEVARIKTKFLKAGCPQNVIRTVVINLPISSKNEHFSRKFLEKIDRNITNSKVKLSI